MVNNLKLECDFCGAITKDFYINAEHGKIACVWCTEEIKYYRKSPENDTSRGAQ